MGLEERLGGDVRDLLVDEHLQGQASASALPSAGPRALWRQGEVEPRVVLLVDGEVLYAPVHLEPLVAREADFAEALECEEVEG